MRGAVYTCHPCPKCGGTERYLSSSKCVECVRASKPRRPGRTFGGAPCRNQAHRDEYGRTERYVVGGRCVACERQRANDAYRIKREARQTAGQPTPETTMVAPTLPGTFDELVTVIARTSAGKPHAQDALEFIALAALLDRGMTADEISAAFFVARDVSPRTDRRWRAALAEVCEAMGRTPPKRRICQRATVSTAVTVTGAAA